ncbi:hypothetical protein SASPL_134498 [Salvia splendens]|uniref:RRM domain-containing protein n=1 Tax=Salvia splendens TaxID=180675 RepID=A0A8X8X682_SALSN|nr:hypothetical protein SASPL_134498 [Salvia splendens]
MAGMFGEAGLAHHIHAMHAPYVDVEIARGRAAVVATVVIAASVDKLSGEDVVMADFTYWSTDIGYADTITDDDLKTTFSEYGVITRAVVMRDADGKSKCFGFVNFEQADDAAKAVNGKKFDEKEW